MKTKRWRLAAGMAVLVGALALTAGFAAAGPQRDPDPNGRRSHDPAPAPGLTDELKAKLHELQQQLQSMRQQFHSELDPLQAQLKALRDKFDPQLQQLQTQIKDLVESGKSPEIQQLDKEEDQELANLADREKAEIDKVKERFADEKKQIQEKFDQRRKEAAVAKR